MSDVEMGRNTKLAVIADLNIEPPQCDDDFFLPPPISPSSVSVVGGEKIMLPQGDVMTEGNIKLVNRSHNNNNNNKSRTGGGSRVIKGEYQSFESVGGGHDIVDAAATTDQQQQHFSGPSSSSSSREDKVSSLKIGLVHVAKKMPKNAHAHFILGLMYQRLCQPQKAVLVYEKAEEILLRGEEDVDRPEFLSSVQIHHAQCILLGNTGDGSSNKELEHEELGEILSKLKESMQVDIRQANIWNTLGLILLRSGRVESAISVLSSLLPFSSDFLDALANLGIAYLRSGNLELSTKCFQDLILKDQNHPAARVNYSVLLLRKYGSVIAGAGADSGEEAFSQQLVAANVAKECLFAAAKADPKSAHIWVNLANAYSVVGDHTSAGKCLEKAAKLEPNCMATRYAVAVHRIKGAERSQDPTEQLSWAGNEMASILREGDSATVEPHLAWAGLAMVHRAEHEITATFESGQKNLTEVEERALYTLKQAIEENPDDYVQWHQLGLYSLCTLQFKASQKYLKAAIARCKECSYVWSNLGISLQLSEDSSQAEEVYKRALSCAIPQQAHTMLSNLGNLYRQQKQYQRAKSMLAKSLEQQPGYAPAYNSLGLVYVGEGCWEDAKICFEKALKSDPLLDAAKSNMMKTVGLESRTHIPIGCPFFLGSNTCIQLEALLSPSFSNKPTCETNLLALATVMASTIATTAMLSAKCVSSSTSPNRVHSSRPTIKPVSVLPLQALQKVSTTSKSSENFNLSSLTGTALAGAVFSTLSSCHPAFAAQQIADIAEGDNRGLALLLPLVPAILWVLYNILQPALNQINKMNSTKGVIVGLGLGGLAYVSAPTASASEVAMIAEASSDNRGLLVLFVVAAAIAWVLFNILQPALNQIDRMKS
ncbi:hypothetical protein IFM89_013186 [Coptis chinensis]|uniref:Uncharacterized protein n=1 Tax=Coptis chinensis TaxID=261450 RepID=A0A835LRP1_9MAGN|nr:hypothetical protein IFM89_013186 [Coptis chinensis]